MTQLEKAQFFAQYFGQKVLHIRNSLIPFYLGSIKVEDVADNDYIELTRLEDISDEDAIGVAKIFNINSPIDIESNKAIFGLHIKLAKEFVLGEFTINRVDNLELISQAIDYLRSKSYALPFRNYSVEQLVELGVVKLK